MPDALCDKCGAYWECEHKHTPTTYKAPSAGNTVVINGKEYEPPKLQRDLNGNPRRKVMRFTAAQVDANKEERRERNRKQASELANKYRKSDQ